MKFPRISPLLQMSSEPIWQPIKGDARNNRQKATTVRRLERPETRTLCVHVLFIRYYVGQNDTRLFFNLADPRGIT